MALASLTHLPPSEDPIHRAVADRIGMSVRMKQVILVRDQHLCLPPFLAAPDQREPNDWRVTPPCQSDDYRLLSRFT